MDPGLKFVGTTEDRFWHYVRKQDDGHWLWTGPVNSTQPGRDYGLLFDSDRGRNVLAHRYSYVLHRGPLADNTEPDHLCRIPRCVAPDHLEAVPHRENIIRGDSPAAEHSRKDTCSEGHELVLIGSKRACRECRNKQARAWYAANRGTGLGTGSTHRARTQCPRGHAYDEDNTYVHPKTGRRDCRRCRRIRSDEARARARR